MNQNTESPHTFFWTLISWIQSLCNVSCMQLAESCLNVMPRAASATVPWGHKSCMQDALHNLLHKSAPHIRNIVQWKYSENTVKIVTVKIVTQIIYQIVLINYVIRNFNRIVNDLQTQRSYSDSSRSNYIQFPKNVCGM